MSLTRLFKAMIYGVNLRELVISRMIWTLRTFSSDRIHRSHGVGKQSLIPVDNLAMLLSMRNLTRACLKSHGPHFLPNATLI